MIESGFEPALSKDELIVRVARVCGTPVRPLGPGSKEHKQVFHDINSRFGLEIDESLNKYRYAEQLSRRLGGDWDSACQSTGYTITLVGLNKILEGAERRARAEGQALVVAPTGPAAEAAMILDFMADRIGGPWDGRTCCEEMKVANFSSWKQTEWCGWYFEYSCLMPFMAEKGGHQIEIGATKFDLAGLSDIVWDLKAHSSSLNGKPSARALLNDRASTDMVFQQGRSLGLVVLSGPARQDQEFTTWHRAFRGGKARREDRRERQLKSEFAPLKLEAFHFPSHEALADAQAAGLVRVNPIGRNSNGRPRPDKYAMDFSVAGETFLVRGLDLAWAGGLDVRL